jgi:hypothetical protein
MEPITRLLLFHAAAHPCAMRALGPRRLHGDDLMASATPARTSRSNLPLPPRLFADKRPTIKGGVTTIVREVRFTGLSSPQPQEPSARRIVGFNVARQALARDHYLPRILCLARIAQEDPDLTPEMARLNEAPLIVLPTPGIVG